MSVRVMAAVFAARIGDASRKAVLLAMADHAADDGASVHPSVDLLMDKTDLSRRTVQRGLRELEMMGLIHEVSRRPDAACHYRIDVAAVAALRRPDRRKTRRRRGVSLTPPREPEGVSPRRTRGVTMTPSTPKGRQRDAGRGVTVTPESPEATTNVRNKPPGEPKSKTTPCAEPPKQPAGSVALARIPDLPANAQNGTHGLAASEIEPIHVKATVVGKAESETTATWNAYAAAWEKQHGTRPNRSARTNRHLVKFIAEVGRSDAPAIAAHYVASREQFYVVKKHPAWCLEQDAQKLRAEWATGQHGTATEARMGDETQARGNIAHRFIAEAIREEAADPDAGLPNRVCSVCRDGFRAARSDSEQRCPACVAADRKPRTPPSQYENFTGRTDEAWNRFRREEPDSWKHLRRHPR
jgi:DNA-binding transcriptional ArsR family regulator/rubrerythrin